MFLTSFDRVFYSHGLAKAVGFLGPVGTCLASSAMDIDRSDLASIETCAFIKFVLLSFGSGPFFAYICLSMAGSYILVGQKDLPPFKK
jgi:hypothetical protein